MSPGCMRGIFPNCVAWDISTQKQLSQVLESVRQSNQYTDTLISDLVLFKFSRDSYARWEGRCNSSSIAILTHHVRYMYMRWEGKDDTRWRPPLATSCCREPTFSWVEGRQPSKDKPDKRRYSSNRPKAPCLLPLWRTPSRQDRYLALQGNNEPQERRLNYIVNHPLKGE
jgi:hypothetical protein